jgi:CRISPR-associated protein Cmr5
MSDTDDFDPRNLSQKRADYAWQCVDPESGAVPESLRMDHARLAQSLTQMIQVNGLGPTIAFLLAKAKGEKARKSAHRLIYDQLSFWVTERVYGQRGNHLLREIAQKPSDQLRRATAEAIALSVWLRRFSEAVAGDVRSSEEPEHD